MNLRLVAFGHRMPAWVSAGFDEYARRLPRDCALTLTELRPEPRDRGKSVPQMLKNEAARLRTACGDALVVALDEHGRAWTTRQLADNLQQWRVAGTAVAFVVGSADGLDAEFKRTAAACVAVSAMTLPHGLVRVLLAEQLYRAASLLAGHPYHRE